jgi:hypothetical protein
MPGAYGVFPLPDDGLCLSVFLVVRSRGRPQDVLLGRVDPAGPWGHVAALDPARLRALAQQWILPASQLLFFEAPDAAVRRVAAEQLGRPDLEPGSPAVFSEAYPRPGGSARDPHWDLHFVYRTDWPGGGIDEARGRLWQELAFVDPGTLAPNQFGRGHGDILALIGQPPKAAPAASPASGASERTRRP